MSIRESIKRILKETYSNDINKIKLFLSELEFPLTLYRALILEKGEKMNKKDLGIHWTLDYLFAKNLFYYTTFGGNPKLLDDYDLYIITAEFDKKDIDFKQTIEKRLIKDSGHFWDELTGEYMENPNMEYHPYSHENEIVVKENSSPRIIKIEKNP